MGTFKMQRSRGDFGHVPAKVLEALVLNSRQDIGSAYRHLDYCYQLAPIGDGFGERRLRNWLTVEGLTPAEVQTVVDHVCKPRGHVAIEAPHAPKPNPSGFKKWTITLAPTAAQRARAKQIVERWSGTLKGDVATWRSSDDAHMALLQLNEWDIKSFDPKGKKRNPRGMTSLNTLTSLASEFSHAPTQGPEAGNAMRLLRDEVDACLSEGRARSRIVSAIKRGVSRRFAEPEAVVDSAFRYARK
jgi:hypothetical protein